MYGLRAILMDAATGGEGGGAGGEAPAPAPAPSPAPAGAPPVASPPARTAMDAAAAGDTFAKIPEKHRVTKEDGSLDVEATLFKNADAYSALEKRFGSGDLPPAAATEYKINVPDALKDVFTPDDPGLQAFLAKAHEKHYSQAQLDTALQTYAEIAPKLVEAREQLDEQACNTRLREVWPDEPTFQAEWRDAIKATKQFSGDRFDKIRDKFGSDPDFIWYAAQVGKQLKEDTTVQVGSGGTSSIEGLLSHPAYFDAKHPDHVRVSSEVRAFYANRTRQ